MKITSYSKILLSWGWSISCVQGMWMVPFQEYQQFGNVKSTVDVPQGRFEGLDEIQDFCSNWLNYAKADSAYAVPVKQTRSGGRSCTELMLHFRYDKYGKEVKFPACVVGDLRGHGQLDEVRMYFFFKWLPDLSPYRHRIFRPSHNAQVELNSVCNVIREYSDALANLHFKEFLTPWQMTLSTEATDPKV